MLKIMVLFFALSGIDAAKNGDYDAALPFLNSIRQDQVPQELYHQFFFYKTTCEFFTLQKKEALASINKFYLSFDKPPRRYDVLIEAMRDDINKWGDDPLADITRKMGEVQRRLVISKGGPITQEKQRQIVKDLDKLIKEMEDKQNRQGEAKINPTQEKDGPNQQAQGNKNSNQAATDSNIMGGSGPGKVDEKRLAQIRESWGTLPPSARAKVIQEITRDLPPKFEPLIKNYFQALDKSLRKP